MADEKKNAKGGAPEIVTIHVLTEHLEQIVDQLQAVIRAAQEIAGRSSAGGELKGVRPPNFLIGSGCQVSIDRARDLLGKPNR